MDEGYAMKKKILFIFAGFLIGVIVCYATFEGVTRTGDDKFCLVCHEMTPMGIAYRNDIHGGAGKIGIKAQCVDCHLPHNNVFNYVLTKAKNGIVEGAIHFFGDVDNIDWYTNRAKRDEFVFDDGCLKCHANFENLNQISKKGKQMHEHYLAMQKSGKKIACASCHFDVGHKELRNILNYFKPEYKIYKDEMQKKKEEILKNFKANF